MPLAKNGTSDSSISGGPGPDRFILSDGRYGTILTGEGNGYSWFDRWALTHWSGDPLATEAGFLFYLREAGRDGVFTFGHRSVPALPGQSECRRKPGRVEIVRRYRDLEIALDTCVAPDPGTDGGFELRRLRVRNRAPVAREVEATSYGEVVLHEPLAHAAHPAFSRLFVRSEFVAERRALLFRRRPRSEAERFPWMIHAVVASDPVEYETDRARFLGRGRDADSPRALLDRHPLAGTSGDVLDPVFALRTRLRIPPEGEAERTFLLGAAGSRASALALTGLPEPAAARDGRRASPLVERGAKAGVAAAVESVFAAAASAETRRWRELGLDPAQAIDLNWLGADLLCGPPWTRRCSAALPDPDLAASYWKTLHPLVEIVPARTPGSVERA